MKLHLFPLRHQSGRSHDLTVPPPPMGAISPGPRDVMGVWRVMVAALYKLRSDKKVPWPVLISQHISFPRVKVRHRGHTKHTMLRASNRSIELHLQTRFGILYRIT